MFESSPDLSVNTVAEIVRLALAPVFLLSGIGAFVNVLASRLSRIVDRSRDIEPRLLASRGREHDRCDGYECEHVAGSRRAGDARRPRGERQQHQAGAAKHARNDA